MASLPTTYLSLVNRKPSVDWSRETPIAPAIVGSWVRFRGHNRYADLPLPIIMMSTPIQGGMGRDQASYDGSTRISEWLEMGARSIHLLPLPNREDLPCAD